MGEAVDDLRATDVRVEMPDLTEVSLREVLTSLSPELLRAMVQVVDEARRPRTTAGFQSFIDA